MLFSRVVFSKELALEFYPLALRHWEETRHFQDIEFKPAWEAYLFAEQLGALRLYVARQQTGEKPEEPVAQGPIFGYAVVVVQPSMNTGLLEAQQIAIYIEPTHRGFGKKFITWYEAQLKSEGVNLLYHHSKIGSGYGPLLLQLGHQPIEQAWIKRLVS